MKKFLLFIVVIIVAIVLVHKLEWSFTAWCFVFAGMLLLRALHLAIKSPDSNDLDYNLSSGASHLFTGGGLSWWSERLFVISEDYTSGSVLSLIYKWGVTILGGLAIVYLIIKGIIWLLSQPVFWIVVGSVAGLALLIFIGIKLNKYQKNRAEQKAREEEAKFSKECEDLVSEFVNEAGVPIPSGAIDHGNFDYCVTAIQNLQILAEEIKNPADIKNLWEMKRRIMDKKLEVFYKVSIPAQAKELSGIAPEEVGMFIDFINNAIEINDFNAIRKPECDEKTIKKFVNSLNKYKRLLDDNTMTPYLDELDKYKNMDTTTLGGFLTSSSKLAEKAKIFRNIYEAAKR